MICQKHQVHIWRVALDGNELVEEKLKSLSSVERTRVASFRSDDIRRRFVISHFALRSILAKYLSREPSTIDIETLASGKPKLSAPNEQQIGFNLSHSGELALIAVTNNVEVGVDLELIKEMQNLDSLISRFLSPREAKFLLACDVENRENSFFQIWTAKEAYLKALGVGLSGELKSFDVIESNTENQIFETSSIPLVKEIEGYSLSSLKIGGKYLATLATQTPNPEISYFDWCTSV